MPPAYLPVFATDAFVSSDTAKQDKIEYILQNYIGIGGRTAEDLNAVLEYIGAPPPVDGHSRQREDYGGTYSEVFNRRTNEELRPQKMNIRSSDLPIRQGRRIVKIPPPLIKGHCDWNYRQGGRQETRVPYSLTGTLVLSANPTRFVRYRSVALPLPEGMQKPLESAPPPYRERSTNGDDNFFPLSGRLYARLKPDQWRAHLERYFRAIEETFDAEVDRVREQMAHHLVRFQPRLSENVKKYNIKVVETYFEWRCEEAVKMVADLAPFTKTFSSRQRREETYLAEPFSEDDRDMTVLNVDITRGERLKIYAKTDQRVRMEVVHQFHKGKHRFQFPRDHDEQGNVIRSSAHTFSTLEEVLQFLERAQRRAADVVNSFLRHVNNQSRIIPSQISAYRALLHVLRAIPNDFSTVQEVTSLLVNGNGLSPGGESPSLRNAIAALCRHGIIEMNERQSRYVITRNYRHAFKMLKEHANFSLLVKRAQGKLRGGSLFAGMD